MVCFGAHFSAVWIVVANSWMQTPAGYHIVGQGLHARAEVTDFWQVVFNPSSMDRLFHTVCGAWQTGAFLVISVSAWYLLKKKHLQFARASLRFGLIVSLAAALLQIISGDSSARGVAKNQPAKLAGFEGLYQTTSNAPLALFGYVDERNQKVVGLQVPDLLTWMVYRQPNGVVIGLNDIPPADRPPVSASFLFFHGMVAIGFALLGIAGIGCFYLWRGTLSEKRWLLWILVFSVLGPELANQLGWFAAEVGRQPWLVWHELRTPDGLSAVVKANAVLSSLILFTFLYFMLFAVFLYLLNDKIQHGPHEEDLIPSGKLALPTALTENP
jgi:cytochrome d ubiquinol oxidase subunit I